MNPWQLYDGLIDLIPHDLRVTQAIGGHVAFVLNDAGGAGIASHDKGGLVSSDRDDHSDTGRTTAWERFEGQSLRDVAGLVKSWNFSEASVGVAAMNSWLNSAERVERSGHHIDTFDTDVFHARAPELTGKKVAVIGHFPNAVDTFDGSDLSILERDPREGDLPDSACEYVLPDSDAVFITGMTVANKTLPRLLQLSQGKRVILVGASVPFAPEVFAQWGSPELATSYVANPQAAKQLILEDAHMPGMAGITRRFTAVKR